MLAFVNHLKLKFEQIKILNKPKKIVRKLKRTIKKLIKKIKKNSIYLKELFFSQPVYKITEKELCDTINFCYKKGLNNDQILQVLNTSPYKWDSVIAQFEEQNLENLRSIFEVPVYESYESPEYNTSSNDYELLKTIDFSFSSDLYEQNPVIEDDTHNQLRNVDLRSKEMQRFFQDSDLTQSESVANINNVNLDYKTYLYRRDLVVFLINNYCRSFEFMQSLCAKFPQYTSEINAYFNYYLNDENFKNNKSSKKTDNKTIDKKSN